MFEQFVNQPSYQELNKNSDTLSFWLFIAAVIHAIVLIGVTFAPPKPKISNKTIEVTLVNSATKKAPDNAKYFAQANQIAAGLEEQKPLPVTKKKPRKGQHSHNQKPIQSAQTQVAIEHRLITQKDAQKKLDSAQKQEDNQEQGQDQQSQPELSMEELDKQIALLELKLQHQKENSEKTNIKSINAISAHKQIAARYIKDWEKKVERVGNLNYPEIQGQPNFSGVLIMDVGVRTDNGVLYDMRIVTSSGIPELDAAAQRIVNMSAPFDIPPAEIAEQTDVLSIRREWVFSNGEAISSTTYLTPSE
jgi:protein TonB